MAAGEFHTMYLTNAGHLYSCGNNEVGQLGRHTDNKEGKTPGIVIISFVKCFQLFHKRVYFLLCLSLFLEEVETLGLNVLIKRFDVMFD